MKNENQIRTSSVSAKTVQPIITLVGPVKLPGRNKLVSSVVAVATSRRWRESMRPTKESSLVIDALKDLVFRHN